MKSRVKGQALPVKSLSEVCNLPEGALVTVPISRYMFGETPHRDLVPICAIVRQLAPRRIFEFGTFTGSTTRALILNATPATEIWTLDLNSQARTAAIGLNTWNKNINDSDIGRSFKGTAEAARIHQLLVNSLEFDPKPYRENIDLIYVDASHNYTHVVNDTAKAFEMISPTGIILWHDYPNFAGVKMHLEELSPSRQITHIQDTNVAIFTNANSTFMRA